MVRVGAAVVTTEHKPTKGPQTPLVDALAAGIKAQANLRQAVWEASQFHSYAHIREYVESVLREIESDEP